MDELGARLTLVPEDLALLTDLPDAGKLGLAVQLAYWRQNGRSYGAFDLNIDARLDLDVMEAA
jgi:hypothetical protein